MLCFGIVASPMAQVPPDPGQAAARQRAAALLQQAIALDRANRLAEAEAAYKTALTAAKKLPDTKDSAPVVKVLGWQMVLYHRQQRYAEGRAAGERALALHQATHGIDHSHTAYLHAVLGAIAVRQRDFVPAEQHLRAVLDAYQRSGSSKERDVHAANAAQELSFVFASSKRFPDAVTAMQISLVIRGRIEPKDYASIAATFNSLAHVYNELKQFDEAEVAFKAAVNAAETLKGPAVAALIDILMRQATFYRDQDRYGEARTAAQRALELRIGRPDLKSPSLVTIYNNLGLVALKQRDPAYAEKQFRLSIESQDREPTKDGEASAAGSAYELANILIATKSEDAEAMLQRAIVLAERASPAADKTLAAALQNLGMLYRAQRKYPAAEAAFRRSLEVGRRAYGPEHLIVAGSLNQLGIMFFEAGRYGDAEGPLLSALTIRSKYNQPLAIAETQVRLSVLYRYLNRYETSERMAQDALAAREAHLKPDDIFIADALFNLAAVYRWQGKCIEAEPLLRRALVIREAAEGPLGVNVLADLNSLAACLDMMGRTAEAEPMLLRALAGREKVLRSDDHNIADTLVNLIYMLRKQGRFDDAAKIAERPLQIYRQSLGPTHPSVVSGLNVLAVVHQDRAEFDKAEALFREALKIRQATYGVDHTSVARSYNDLTRLSLYRRQFEEAAGYASKALEINEKWFGVDDARLVASLRDLATLRRLIEQFDSAEVLLKRALAISERAGDDTLPVAVLSLDLAYLNRSRGKFGDIEKYYDRPLAIYRRIFGERHPLIAGVLDLRADLDIALGQPQEAERRFDESLGILVEAYGKESPVLNFVINNKANLLRQLGRPDEAEQLYKQAVALLRKGAGRGSPALPVVLFNLADLYAETGRPDAATRLREEGMALLVAIYGADRLPPIVRSATLPPPPQEI
jgi:tetratricopeptide (TPR) repeat protein